MALFPAASYLRTVARLTARGLAARGKAAVLPKERLVLERTGIRIYPRQLARYLAVTEATGIARFQGEEALLPPIYSALWEAALGLELLGLPEIPPVLGGVIHLESECVPLRSLRLSDRVRCRLELEKAEPDARGVCLRLLSRNWNGAGQLCSENRMLVLLRGAMVARGPSTAGEGTEDSQNEGEVPRTWEEIARWKLRGNHGRRYARVSGDYNPIHLWSWTARPFGFRRPILHGFCIEALVAHALIARLWDGDPARLRRLRISFRSPLVLPARASLLIGEASQGGHFRVVKAEEGGGGRIYAEGSFLGA